MQARGNRAAAHSCPRNHGVFVQCVFECVFEYRCCACLTPSQQTKAGEHSGVCASAKVNLGHGEATFVPCKHNPASMKLCHAACVCVCVCVPRGIKSVSAGDLRRHHQQQMVHLERMRAPPSRGSLVSTHHLTVSLSSLWGELHLSTWAPYPPPSARVALLSHLSRSSLCLSVRLPASPCRQSWPQPGREKAGAPAALVPPAASPTCGTATSGCRSLSWWVQACVRACSAQALPERFVGALAATRVAGWDPLRSCS